MTESAPGMFCTTYTNFELDFCTISASLRKAISLPAPGVLPMYTCTGLVGSQANTLIDTSIKARVKSFFIVPPNINMMTEYLCHLA